jgi:DNA processing protein
MSEKEIIYQLALQKVKGIGNINAKKLIKHCGSAEAVFNEKQQNLLKIDGIGAFKLKGLKEKSLLAKAEKEFLFTKKNNIKTTSYFTDDYPELLKNASDSPLIYFQKGKIDFNNKRIISIVGTRNITNYGKSFLEKLFNEIKEYNPLIVSGLAYGVDVLAHQLAIKNNLQTVAILAHGLNQIYPKTHHKEATKMLENGGLITEFWSTSNPDRENFVKRNRIVAGLSQATIIIESAMRGGSLITADIANSYNRDVFAVPGRVSDLYSTGCNNLIKTNKASMLTTAKDLVYLLNWDIKEKLKVIQKQLFIELDPTEEKIYNYLLNEGKQTLDMIALHCNYPIYKISSILLNLELKGVVKPLHGKLFEAV